ncbi:conserved hypothetical protein [Histoplasma capsulatum H143]|uniref:FAR1 domain-containing protein n=1 Tax=Ajellomyces capsulatus (strain H143) TaxID=544712 RepID=C6HMJ6_AJECH|nr:conserved hypothetical protein [Histoplasma capsulatum H143]
MFRSTAPESQSLEVERPSQFDLETFIEEEGVFNSIREHSVPSNDEELADRIESQFLLQDGDYEEIEEFERTLEEGDHPPPAEPHYIIACDRSGQYRNSRNVHQEDSQRLHTSPSETDCPYRLSAKKGDTEWIIVVKNSSHNHSMSEDSRAHPMHRLRSANENVRAMIQNLAKTGFPARTIRITLSKHFERVSITARDLYNINVMLLLGELKGPTPIQALIDELMAKEDGDTGADWKKDQDNQSHYSPRNVSQNIH